MSKITQLSMLLMCLLALHSAKIEATTIIPFENLGALALQSDAVVRAKAVRSFEHLNGGTTYFRTKFVVLDQIKGNLLKGDDFDVQKWERVIDDKWMTMWGDIDLYDGSTYLLFLEQKESGLYHPLCFSYYLFEEITMEGEAFMVPSIHAKEFELVNDDAVEALDVYHKKGIIQELRDVVNHNKEWNSKSFVADLGHEDFFERQHQRAGEPDHCNYLTSNNKHFRWPDFSSLNVGIHYNASGQVGCANANALALQCINDLNTAYPSINLVDGGTVPALANCADASALGSDYRTWISSNLGGQRHVVIQYDDPCNEISDLSGCSGILAIGGLYGIGSHIYNGETWFTGGYGYVVVNNGVGGCKCSQMGDILTHEVTHALGLGHILSSQGAANMNPSCCQTITSLDEECVSFAYDDLAGALPLELISFKGDADRFINILSWETAWEANVAKFILQRANDVDRDFADLADINAKGDTDFGHTYEFSDIDPDDESYYRLKSVDHDGQTDFSELVVISREKIANPVVYPTQTRDALQVRLPEEEKTQIEIVSPAGQLQQVGEINDGYTVLSVNNLAQGWYYLKLENESYSETFKFFKSE